MAHWSDIAPALPPEAVKEIWAEVDPHYVTVPERLYAFVEIAIDHPHYASVMEIADALGETRNRITPLVYKARDVARKNRVFTSST